jgi:2-polyprenyl-3-methyl-5-hydroxy-6-metoxy-1,4-benzoquinol methylase
VVGDVESLGLPFERGEFDVVLCADIIEHLRDPLTFLRRSRALIAIGGKLVLSTPNIANWSIRVALLAGRFSYKDRGILDRTHTHLFTRRSLLECLDAAGYRVERLDFTAPVPLIGTPAVEGIAHVIAGIRPTLFAYQFVVTASAG